jgi:TnpA family transposase
MREQSFEKQQYRASGLNSIVSAIVLMNEAQLEGAVEALQKKRRNRQQRLPAATYHTRMGLHPFNRRLFLAAI